MGLGEGGVSEAWRPGAGPGPGGVLRSGCEVPVPGLLRTQVQDQVQGQQVQVQGK
jgi:hypothetical protein